MSLLSKIKSFKNKSYLPTRKNFEDKISFYWSKKSISDIHHILKHFVKKNDIIFDPFFGSGSLMYAANNLDFDVSIIANEINELPLNFVKFNLSNFTNEEIQNTYNLFMVEFKKLSKFYDYKNFYYDEYVNIDKLIIDRNNQISIKEFHLISSNKIKKLSPEINSEIFQFNQNLYFKRFNKCKSLIKDLDIELLENSRIAIKRGMKLSDIFNPINFYVLKQLQQSLGENKIFNTILASVLHLCRLTDLKSQSQFPFWIPKQNIIERNILITIQKKFLTLIKNYNNKNKFKLTNNLTKISSNNILLFNKPSQNITNKDIKDKSLDLIITDPPYFDQVAYSEYSVIWKYFCNFKTNLKDEIIVSNRKKFMSDETIYLKNLEKVFQICNLKLKDDGLCIVFFKDSKFSNIQKYLKVMNFANFKLIDTFHLKKKKFTYKQNTTKDTTVMGECLFFFMKGSNKLKNTNKLSKEIVRDFVKNYYKTNNKSTLAEIYDNGLIMTLYENDRLNDFKSSKEIFNAMLENLNKINEREYEIKV